MNIDWEININIGKEKKSAGNHHEGKEIDWTSAAATTKPG
jgi:hypothetical protein